MLERWLRRHIPYDTVGWKEIGEVFTRYNVLKTRWFSVYIHQMWAPIAPPLCHDHPWSFVTFIISGGYWETTDGTNFKFIRPGLVLYRPAHYTHTVKTVKRFAWTFVITGPRSNDWHNHDCRTGEIVQTS